MKKLLSNLMLLIFPVPVCCLFSSCSSDDDSCETSKDVGFFLNFRQDGDRDPYFNWTTEWEHGYFCGKNRWVTTYTAYLPCS